MPNSKKRIPDRIAYQLSGFAQGEGCFFLSVKPRKDCRLGIQVNLGFNVSNHDDQVLALFRHHLKCGTLRDGTTGKGETIPPELKTLKNMRYFEVNKTSDLVEIIIPFFKKYGFVAYKAHHDFSVFCKMLEIKSNNSSLSFENILSLLSLRNQMLNSKQRRHYTDLQLFEFIEKKLESTVAKSNPYSLELIQVKEAIAFLKKDEKTFWTYKKWNWLTTGSSLSKE